MAEGGIILADTDSINNEVIGLINHCEFVKELMEYLNLLYYGKGNVSYIYEACQAFYRAEKHDMSLTIYLMDLKRTYEELNMLLPFTPDVKIKQNQRKNMVVISFFVSLPSKFETTKSQILFSFEITSLQDVFSRVLCTENSLVQYSGALVSWTNEYEVEQSHYRGSNKGGANSFDRTHDLGGIVIIVINQDI